MNDVLTVREAVRRAKTDGLAISEHSLRVWVRAGAIPTRKVGQKALIFYPNLVRFIQCSDGADNVAVPVIAQSGIRRIER